MNIVKANDKIKFFKRQVDENIIGGKHYLVVRVENITKKDYNQLITIKNDKNKEYTFKSLDEIFKTFISEEEMTKRYLEIPYIYSEYDIIKNMMLCDDEHELFELNIERLRLINEIYKLEDFQTIIALFKDDNLSNELLIIDLLDKLHSMIEEKAYNKNSCIGMMKNNKNYWKNKSNQLNNDQDEYDAEEEVMKAFRNGTQDLLGY